MRRINEYIALGLLAAGDRLPSIRSIAKQSGVSTISVYEAYVRLENLHIIESRPRSGYFVAAVPRGQATGKQAPPVKRTALFTMADIIERYVQCGVNDDLTWVGSTLPGSDYFPNAKLSQYLARCARRWPKKVNSYSMGKSEASLIKMTARFMMNAECMVAQDEITITNGATQAILSALRALVMPGEYVAVESPGYVGFFNALKYLYVNPLEIPSSVETGLDVDALAAYVTNGVCPACLILSSNFSQPTGSLMPAENKARLLALCARYHIPIIEDDVLGELYFGLKRPKPLKSMAPDEVIYISSYSKLFAPGYRVGWVAGGKYADDIRRAYALTSYSQPVITQMATAIYLKEGGIKSQLNKLRQCYRQNREIVVDEVKRHFPAATKVTPPQGGQYLWLALPETVSASKLFIAAAAENILITPGAMFTAGSGFLNCLRLNFGQLCDDQFRAGLKRVGQLACALANGAD